MLEGALVVIIASFVLGRLVRNSTANEIKDFRSRILKFNFCLILFFTGYFFIGSFEFLSFWVFPPFIIGLTLIFFLTKFVKDSYSNYLFSVFVVGLSPGISEILTSASVVFGACYFFIKSSLSEDGTMIKFGILLLSAVFTYTLLLSKTFTVDSLLLTISLCLGGLIGNELCKLR